MTALQLRKVGDGMTIPSRCVTLCGASDPAPVIQLDVPADFVRTALKRIVVTIALTFALMAPGSTYSKEISKAFGMTLGQPVIESRLTSRTEKDEQTYPGALRADFRPTNPYPGFESYTVWFTQQSKTVVVILADVDHRRYLPRNTKVPREKMAQHGRVWQQMVAAAEEMRFVLLSRLESLYGAFERKSTGGSDRKLWLDKYSDGGAEILLVTRCWDARRREVRGYGCHVNLWYTAKDYKKRIAKESRETQGL